MICVDRSCFSSVVRKICLHEEHQIRGVAVRVYPYSHALSTALYGPDRPDWKMPEPFTEMVDQAVWRFLESRNLWGTIGEQMKGHLCSVSLEGGSVKLRPLPGLTPHRADSWRSAAQAAFHQLMSQYGAFRCPMSRPAWAEAEPRLRAAVGGAVELLVDTSSQSLTVAGRVPDIKRLEAVVKNVADSAMRKVERERAEVTESVKMDPTLFCLLEQMGLQEASRRLSPHIKLSHDNRSRKLTFRGVTSDILQVKLWISETRLKLTQKKVEVAPVLLDFLQTIDSEDVSQNLFTSKGTCASYSIKNNGVFLLAPDDQALAAAELKIRAAFHHLTIGVEDPEVLNLPEWKSLLLKLLTDNSSKVDIVTRGDQVTVVGFLELVEAVTLEVKQFIVDHSRVEEVIQVRPSVFQFLVKNKSQDLNGIVDRFCISKQTDEERSHVSIAGARHAVLEAKALLLKMVEGLFTDQLVVDKPGAKKYFQVQGILTLSSHMSELNCVVVLGPGPGEEAPPLCKVTTPSGVQVSVSQADICTVEVDAVVNAANEDLQHMGGLALALLNAAGPKLQEVSNDYVARNGPVHVGDAIATDAYGLPCRYVIHAVGPRFSAHRQDEAVRLLKRAATQSLKEAERLRCSSVAMPAISAGMFGFPLQLCADALTQAVWRHCGAAGGRGSLREVRLVVNQQQTAETLASALKKVSDNQGAGPGASG